MFEKPALEAIARMLGLMVARPNLRSQPLSGDRPGAFTQWFDGGAISIVTGYTVFEFTDGGHVFLPTAFPHILIQLASGEHLSLSLEDARATEEPRPAAPPPAGPPPAMPMAMPAAPLPPLNQPAALSCPRCQHSNVAAARFCSECGATLGLMAQPSAAVPAPPIAQPSIPVASAAVQPGPVAAPPITVTPPLTAQIETIPPADKKCPGCGSADNKPGARFCRRCGKPLI